MRSPSPSAYSLNEQHYLFLSRSLNDLERLVERHRAEYYLIFDRLIDAGFMEPQIQRQTTRRHYHTTSIHPDQQLEHPNSSNGHHRRRSLNVAIAELGTRENPIYVMDDEDVLCKCTTEGHHIVDCTREHRFDEQVRTTGTEQAIFGRIRAVADTSCSDPSHNPRF